MCFMMGTLTRASQCQPRSNFKIIGIGSITDIGLNRAIIQIIIYLYIIEFINVLISIAAIFRVASVRMLRGSGYAGHR